MSGTYIEGERKVRPGIYRRVKNNGGIEIAGVREGIACAVVSGNWGPLNVATKIDASEDWTTYVGTGTGYDTLRELFAGGARSAVVVRIGAGGTCGTVTLKGTQKVQQSTQEADAIKITAKYPGDRKLSISIRKSLSNEKMKEATIYDGVKLLETVTFAAGDDDVEGLHSALKDSKFVGSEVVLKNCSVKEVQQKALEKGANPTVNVSAYSDGFTAVEPEVWDVLCVDTVDPDVIAAVVAYMDRIVQGGSLPMAVVSQNETEKTFDERISFATAYDDEKLIYLFNGWVDTAGKNHEGYLAAARIAGMVTAIPANDSLTHDPIDGAVSLIQPLTNSQIEKAINAGAFVISKSKTGQIVVEKAINTFKTVTEERDSGWKKIRRVKTRYELMYRCDTTTEPMVGAINNDTNGRASVMAAIQGVIDAMVGEGKILEGGTVYLDEANPPEGDSAWFIIQVDDIDSFEIGYFTYLFRFSPNA